MQKETGLDLTEKRVTASQGEWSNTAERYTCVDLWLPTCIRRSLTQGLLVGHRSASEESEQTPPKSVFASQRLGIYGSGRCVVSVSEALDRVFRVQRRISFVQYVYRRTVFYFDAVARHFVLPNMSCRLPDQSLRIAVFDVFLSRGRRSVAIVVRYVSSGSESFLRSPSKRSLLQTPSLLCRQCDAA